MTKRAYIQQLNKRANARIEWARSSKNNLFTTQTEELIETLFDKTSKLNNVSSGRLRMGGLSAQDEQMYINAVENFLENPITTYGGQRGKILDKQFNTFKENHPSLFGDDELTKENYADLVRIWESDTFQKFKENFGTYSGVINEMSKNPKDYRRAISFLAGVNRSNKEHGKFATNGELNVKAFIDEWNSRK